ncbi:MAG: 1-acyl-sn-glycerol-3-phosphate acyltransferase [Bacteroidetes bacterium]|nr:1-acyl-sn-glycerol-3-phosphate acyltransferase [Bacteroidota bacterium]
MGKLLDQLKKIRIIKSIVYTIAGSFSYPGLVWINKLKITGTEHLEQLPKENVLFVSNHQTYFADVIAFLHVFCAVKWGKRNRLGVPFYLLNPFTNVYYVGAATTLEKNWLTRFFALAGAIPVKRTWNSDSNEERKGLETADFRNIEKALESSWVITFPQGTTKPFAPGRKGTALTIKRAKPVVVPIVIGGFSEAFDKKGLRFKKRGTQLTIKFKEPMRIDYDASSEKILEEVMDAIEQSKSFMPRMATLSGNNPEIKQQA